MRTKLRLFLDWGITFGKPYEIAEKSHRKVHCADKSELEFEIMRQNNCYEIDEPPTEDNKSNRGGQSHTPKAQTAREQAQEHSDHGSHAQPRPLRTE